MLYLLIQVISRFQEYRPIISGTPGQNYVCHRVEKQFRFLKKLFMKMTPAFTTVIKGFVLLSVLLPKGKS